jgi:hypothetical protein
MARSYGRLFTSIWDDADFCALSVNAKLMYGFLISQPELEHSGIIPFRPGRWARSIGMPVEDVIASLKELDAARFTVTDEEEWELLVRSLIRRDDIWKQPNVFKAAATSAKGSKSAPIKAALYREIRRLDLTRTGRETQAIRDELLTLLEPFANPSPNPPEGFPKGSNDHSPGDTGTPAEPSGNGSGPRSVDNPAESGKGPGQNPSGTVRESLANDSAGPTGKGEGYGPVLVGALPRSPTPSPVTPAEPTRPLWPTAVPDLGADEDPQDETLELPDLVAKVRALRDDWSSDSIARVMALKAVRERPWPLACAAMLLVAADPASEHPGRLAHDGPWWKAARPAPHKRVTPVETHPYEPACDDTDTCTGCGFPEANRRHARAS